MFKATFCLRRLPGMTREEFHRYWIDVHGPMVVKYKQVLGVRRYVQTHTLPEGSVPNLERHGLPEPFDGVAELWYDSKEAYLAALATPEGLKSARLLFEDGNKFIDGAKSSMFGGEEHVLVEG